MKLPLDLDSTTRVKPSVPSLQKWSSTIIAGAFLSSLAFVQPLKAQVNDQVFQDDNLIILDVRHQKYKLGNGVEGYQFGDSLYFALVDVVALLEMPIRVNSSGAKGSINESTKFNLETGQGSWQVEVEGKDIKVEDGVIAIHDDLIFVTKEALELWFPIELKVNPSDAVMTVVARGKLPFQDAITRKERIISNDPLLGEYSNPLADIPYDLWEVPSADLRITHLTSRSKTNDYEINRATNYTFSSNGDLGFMSSNIFVNGNREDGINNVSMRFNRFDSERDMGGPLRLSQVSFGDISAPGAISSSGRGFLVSNESNTSQIHRDITVIEGNHYPGWEVELYLGENVIDYQIVDESGRYYFENVVLSQGNNDYRLVFYGPTGEKEVESRNLYVGEDSEDLRRLRVTASINQPNTRLYSDNETSSTWQANVVTRYALTNFLSFNAAYSLRQWDSRELSEERVLEDELTDEFYVAGINAHILGQTLSANFTQTNDDPYDVTYSLGGGKRALSYRLSHTQFGETETGQTYDPLTDTMGVTPLSETSVTLRSRMMGLNSLLDAQQTSFENYDLKSGRLIVGGRAKSFHWSKGFEYEQSYNEGLIDDYVTGDFFAGSSLGPLSARVNLNYIAKPEAEISSLGFATDLRLSDSVDVSFDFNHTLLTEQNTYRLGMKWVLPFLTVTPHVAYNDSGIVSGNLTLLMTMGNRTGQFGNYYAAESRTISSRGTLKARLFEDENGDGRYTVGERLLSGGVIHSLQTRQKAQSDDVGIALISNVRAWFPSDIVYENDTIEDFAMKYGGEKFAIEMRPGKVIEVDLPFYKAGDIDGTVYSRRSDGRVRAARGITVELVDAKGEVIAKTVSSSDGFYSFQRVLPGKYRVIPKGQQTLSSSVNEAVITTEGNFIGGYDVVILEDAVNSNSASVVAPNGSQSMAQNNVTNAAFGESGINP